MGGGEFHLNRGVSDHFQLWLLMCMAIFDKVKICANRSGVGFRRHQHVNVCFEAERYKLP